MIPNQNPSTSTTDSTTSSLRSFNQKNFSEYIMNPNNSNPYEVYSNGFPNRSNRFAGHEQQLTDRSYQYASPSYNNSQSSNPYAVYSQNSGQRLNLSKVTSPTNTAFDQANPNLPNSQSQRRFFHSPEAFQQSYRREPRSPYAHEQLAFSKNSSNKSDGQSPISLNINIRKPVMEQFTGSISYNPSPKYNPPPKTSPQEQRFENPQNQITIETREFFTAKSEEDLPPKGYDTEQPKRYNPLVELHSPQNQKSSDKLSIPLKSYSEEESPYAYLKYIDSKNQERSRSKDQLRKELESKLENKKKELNEISKLVDVYKRKTETIQSSILTTQVKSVSLNTSRSISPNLSPKKSVEYGGDYHDYSSKTGSRYPFEDDDINKVISKN